MLTTRFVQCQERPRNALTHTASALDQSANKSLTITFTGNSYSWDDVLWDQSLQKEERSCNRNSGKIFHTKNIHPFDRAATGIYVTLRWHTMKWRTNMGTKALLSSLGGGRYLGHASWNFLKIKAHFIDTIWCYLDA